MGLLKSGHRISRAFGSFVCFLYSFGVSQCLHRLPTETCSQIDVRVFLRIFGLCALSLGPQAPSTQPTRSAPVFLGAALRVLRPLRPESPWRWSWCGGAGNAASEGGDGGAGGAGGADRWTFSQFFLTVFISTLPIQCERRVSNIKSSRGVT